MIAGSAAAASVLGACGGGAAQDAHEPSGNFNVEVQTATFPANQTLSEHARLVITVVNKDKHPIPDIAVTICNRTCKYPTPKDSGQGTQSQPFAERLNMPNLAYPSRPVWIVDRAPGPHSSDRCPNQVDTGYSGNNYSSCSGGPGGAVTAYSNTWALGPLQPGQTAKFEWLVTAVKAGTHVVNYVVAAGLNGKAKAVTAGGQPPEGTFTVKIRGTPAQAYVNDRGQVVEQHARR
jgi:hypothetical protein